MLKPIFEKIEEISNKYPILYWIRIFILIIMFLCTFIALRKIFFEKKDSTPIATELKPVDSYKDKYDNLRADIRVQEIEDEKEFKRVTDSFKKVLRGRTRISSVTTTASKADTYFVNVPIYIDTSDSTYYFIKEDNYISIYGNVDITNRRTDISYKSWDTTTFIIYDRKRFLKSDIRTVNISNKNPYNTITHGNSVELKQQKSIFTVGPMVGYDVINNRVSAGVGIMFNVFSIKTRK